MKLAAYLADAKIKLTDFATMIGANVSTLHDWKSGRRLPRADALAAIERATGGKVTASDFVEAPGEGA